jgi:hypothetical protein
MQREEAVVFPSMIILGGLLLADGTGFAVFLMP